jgi:ABC-type branched-subunit amino acid transport system substrate-binding protein
VTDVRPQVATLLSGGTDCVFAAAPPTVVSGLIKGVRASGQKVKVSLLMSVASPTAMRQLGSAAQGVYASSPFLIPGATEAGTQYGDAMKSVDPKATLSDQAEGAYTGVLMFANVAKSLTDFSGPKVLEALNQAKGIDVGTIAPLPSLPANSGIPGLPRVNVTSLYSYVFKGDKYILVSHEPVDVKSGLM